MYFQKINPRRHVMMNMNSKSVEFIPFHDGDLFQVKILGSQGAEHGEVVISTQEFLQMIRQMKDEGDFNDK